MELFKKILNNITDFLKKVWKYINEHSWLKPTIIVSLVVVIATSIIVPSLIKNSNDNSSTTENLIDYNLTIKTLGNNRINDVEISIYDNETLVEKVVTDYLGNAELKLNAKEYTVKLDNLKDGMFEREEGYKLDEKGGNYTFYVDSSVIEKEIKNTTRFKLGDIMYDFSFTDTDGNTHSLKETLKTKDLVLINFWASWCSPCQKEFPYLNAAYKIYKDSVEYFMLSCEPEDTLDIIEEIKEDKKLKFPMGRDENNLYNNFQYRYIPATVIVNKYGIITFSEQAPFTSEDQVAELFEENLRVVSQKGK